MAVISPRREDIANLPTPLNPGEQRVLEVLERLDDNWRVYVQPSLHMDQPDFVVVHDRFGVCAIEVKNWARGLYRQLKDGTIEVREGGGWARTREAPRLQAHRYRRTIVEHFFASPESGTDVWPVVRAMVVLPNYSTAEAGALLRHTHLHANSERHVRVWGGDGLESSLLEMLTGPRSLREGRVEAAHVQRLERQLAEPEVVADQRRPLVLSAAAKDLERNPNVARIRRARGPAGSGKSLGLAARATRLAQQGKEVLVLSFNITLPHYLHDLAARHGRELGVRIRNITFIHFHGFCRQAREDGEVAGVAACRVRCEKTASDEVKAEALVTAALAAYQAGEGRRFDAVLVDEGQDFTARWWNFLREWVVNEGGEMLLVADTTQDLYDRAVWTAEPSMVGCGFSGPWTSLPGSYRMPPDLVPIIACFGERFLTDSPFDPPVLPEDHPMRREATEPTVRRWVNLGHERDLGVVLAREVRALLEEHRLAPADVVFLCEEHAHGLRAAQILEGEDVYVSHVFTECDDEERRRRKHRFWGGADGVKGCTVHSFKGWEARGVVLCILSKEYSPQLAYVALTRVKGDPRDRAAVVCVLNCNSDLDDFQSEFERPLTVAEVPALGGQQRLL